MSAARFLRECRPGILLRRRGAWLVGRLGLVLLVATGERVVSDPNPPFYQSAGTQAMARRLRELADGIDASKSTFFSKERADQAGAALEPIRDPKSLLNALPHYALELLNAGRTDQAIEAYARTARIMQEIGVRPSLEGRVQMGSRLAVAFLRQGEQDNCLTNHTIESCLLPIRGRGVHINQRGSRAAIEVLTRTLGDAPDDLSLRWLLNIAYMTVGEYPQKVPAQWLIPPKTFESEYDIKRFVDVAGVAGLDLNELSGGSLMEDFDGDGLLDLMVTSFGRRDQMRYFRNEGDGTFKDRTREAGLLGETGGLNLVHADYNNDGYPDVFVLRGAWLGTEGRQPNSLLKNNGNGTFDDVTEQAGMLRFHPTQTAVWFDYDLDGWIDLFVGNETAFGEVAPCELYRNNQDGTFTECAAAAGLDLTKFVKGVVAGDFNNDGRPDLYVSVRNEPNLLFRNDGPKGTNGVANGGWVFTEVGRQAGVSEPKFSFPCWFWDYDNDGWEDLFVAGYSIGKVGDVAADYLGLPHGAERARLYRNKGDGTFADVTRDVGLFKVIHAMGANFGDLDNDGWLDFYAGTGDPSLMTLIPNRMFRNAEGRRFQEVTTSGGFGNIQKGHGVSFGDIDNDGDQDVHEDMGGAYPGDVYRNSLYLNPGHGQHWMKLQLQGVQSNRAALGARVKITLATPQGLRLIHRTITTGGSFGGNPLRLEVGLGNATGVQQIEIFWPVTGRTQVFTNAELDRTYRIREDRDQLDAVDVKTFQFRDPSSATHAHHHP